MLGVFGSLQSYFHPASPRADTFVFKLHYRMTVTLLLFCCILACCYQFIGSPIQCHFDAPHIRTQTINMYCWISSTFSLPRVWNKKIGQEIPYPGLGTASEEDKVTYHSYYQWVPFVLFFQAILFYMPRFIWRLWDGGRMKTIILGLNSTGLLLHDNDRKDKEKILSSYVVNHLHENAGWAFKFFVCEVLNFINVIVQIHFTDMFLGYQFGSYGINALSTINDDTALRRDLMTEVFPKVTKCTFHSFGASGTIQTHDVLCVLAVNIINEKIFIFLWFWFVILAVVSGVSLVIRLALIGSPMMRITFLKRFSKHVHRRYLDVINSKCQYGDWFLVYSLGRNLNSFVFPEFLIDLADVMDTPDPREMKPLMNPTPSSPEEEDVKAPRYSLADAPDGDDAKY